MMDADKARNYGDEAAAKLNLLPHAFVNPPFVAPFFMRCRECGQPEYRHDPRLTSQRIQQLAEFDRLSS